MIWLIITILIVTVIFLWSRTQVKNGNQGTAATGVVLGSGGHTSEMLKLLKNFDRDIFSPRIYYVADTDELSTVKLEQFEKGRSDYVVLKIPRAREVGQSYFSSAFTFLRSFFSCLRPVYSYQVDILLLNGPGTCVPVCLNHMFLQWRTNIIFIESICRVKTLSFTCQILRRIVSSTLVQWPELAEKYKGTTYIGQLL